MYSGLSNEKWWIFPQLCNKLPEGMLKEGLEKRIVYGLCMMNNGPLLVGWFILPSDYICNCHKRYRTRAPHCIYMRYLYISQQRWLWSSGFNLLVWEWQALFLPFLESSLTWFEIHSTGTSFCLSMCRFHPKLQRPQLILWHYIHMYIYNIYIYK